MCTLIKLEYTLVHVYACDMITQLRSLNILFMAAISGIYYFKASDVIHLVKEKY